MSEIASIQHLISNKLDEAEVKDKMIVGIIGDAPSQYAKSPTIWNAAFRALNMKAVYLPFDVEAANLSGLIEELRRCKKVRGFSVTVPYKEKVLKSLDEVDEKAKRIGAVNLVVKTPDSKLIGYNTDGMGFIDSLTKGQSGLNEPFMNQLMGKSVLLIGAGGAAKAITHYLAERLGPCALYISNRTHKAGQALVHDVHLRATDLQVSFVPEDETKEVVLTVDIIVNATTKGSSGIRKLPDGSFTCLEPYSALAPANPAAVHGHFVDPLDFYNVFYKQSISDILRNNRLSKEIFLKLPKRVGLVDIIYSPLETVFLKDGRLSGHRTLNGKVMNVFQAAEAFMLVFKDEVAHLGGREQMFQQLSDIMFSVW